MTYPIVLAHGVCRFDKIWTDALELDNNNDPKLDQLHYFKGIRTELMKHGFTVYHSNVGWGAGVETRARELKDNVIQILEKEGSEKVNIIAHSMGGLDARHMLFNFRDSHRLHERVGSLTTISTPHEGSPFADWGTDNLPYVIPVAQKLGLSLKGLHDLRTDKCRRFNTNPEVIEFEKHVKRISRFRRMRGFNGFGASLTPLSSLFTSSKKKKVITMAWFP